MLTRNASWLSVSVACTIGFACGRAATHATIPLPPAGSPRDDGSGLLARLSFRAVLGGHDGPALQAYGGTSYAYANGAAYGGEFYGGVGYGVLASVTYGGSRYANYAFDTNKAPAHVAPAPYTSRYLATTLTTSGNIEGTVLWPSPPHALAELPLPPNSCGKAIANETLQLKNGRVANAVVFLEDITTGRSLLGRTAAGQPNTMGLQVGGVVELRDCRFSPHMQVMGPIGSALTITSHDDSLVNVTGHRWNGPSREALFTGRLGARGSSVEELLEQDGWVELGLDRPADPSQGWVVVMPHPYYAITDEDGHFELEDVPPGTYQLATWHEGVTTAFDASGARQTDAILIHQKVTVKVDQTSSVTIKLPATK